MNKATNEKFIEAVRAVGAELRSLAQEELAKRIGTKQSEENVGVMAGFL